MGVCTARLSRECVSLWGPRWQAGLWEVCIWGPHTCACMGDGSRYSMASWFSYSTELNNIHFFLSFVAMRHVQYTNSNTHS